MPHCYAPECNHTKVSHSCRFFAFPSATKKAFLRRSWIAACRQRIRGRQGFYFEVVLILSPFLTPAASFDLADIVFPDDFIFGSATASYQVEGAWNVSGKGENIWDNLTHTTPDAVINGENGDTSCNSYYYYKDDIKLLKDIGFQLYRFSLSWSRLFPGGYITELNDDGLWYYNALIDELLINGIQPMVTLYHWDLPQPLQDVGGWLNPKIVDIFGEYAKKCFELFGDRVKWWLTINEPVLITRGYGKTEFAPMLNMHGTGEYISGHNILKAHAKAYRIYDKDFRQKQGGKLSIAYFGNFYLPKNESSLTDIEAAERINEFTIGWFAHPIFSKEGDYPEVMKDYVHRSSIAEGRNESRLPIFSQDEIKEIIGTSDYFGLNHYSSKLATFGVTGNNPSIDRDMEVIYSSDPDWPQTAYASFQVVPQGMGAVLRWIKEKYNNPEVFITENGFPDNGDLNDDRRIDYHTAFLKEVLSAMNNDSCKVIGYNVWSLLDNFEWMNGYSLKFGIIHVDFNDPNRSRTPKLSSEFFKELILKNSKGIASIINFDCFIKLLTSFYYITLLIKFK